MPHWRLFYHVVWATRDREPLIGDAEEAIIRRSLQMTLDDLRVVTHAIGTMPDHVHVVLSIPPRLAISEVVKRMKGAATHGVNERRTADNGGTFAWQRDYGVYSFGERALHDVVAYVTNQPSRHADRRLWPTLEQVVDADQSTSVDFRD